MTHAGIDSVVGVHTVGRTAHFVLRPFVAQPLRSKLGGRKLTEVYSRLPSIFLRRRRVLFFISLVQLADSERTARRQMRARLSNIQ